jgi:hypothetical protein
MAIRIMDDAMTLEIGNRGVHGSRLTAWRGPKSLPCPQRSTLSAADADIHPESACA